MKFRLFKSKLFAKTPEIKTGGGLFATTEELIEQKRYIAYLKNFHHKMASSHQAGDVKSAFKGRGIELEEIRPYNYGDDIRDMDWRVTARKQTPYTRLYAEEKDREVYALIDLSPQMVFGTRKELKSVSAAKIAALLGWLSMENKDRFGVGVYDGEKIEISKSGNSRANLIAMLKKIAATSKKIIENKVVEKESLAKAITLLSNRLKNQATVFVISDFVHFDEIQKKALAQLARKSRVWCVNIFDVLEEKAPVSGEYTAASLQGQKVSFNTADKEFVTTYESYFRKKREQLKSFCHSFGIRYVEIRTDLELYEQLKVV